MKNKEIFKVGDTVYQWQYGKGKVTRTYDDGGFPIVVKFASGFITTFTEDGRYSTGQEPCLSLTPYDLVNGGFSQERTPPDIEVDTLVYVRDSLSKEWKMRYFSHFDDSGMINCFLIQDKYKDRAPTIRWMEWSLTNPLEEK